MKRGNKPPAGPSKKSRDENEWELPNKPIKQPGHVRAQDAYRKPRRERDAEDRAVRTFQKAAVTYNQRTAYNKMRRRFKRLLDAQGLAGSPFATIRDHLSSMKINIRDLDQETADVLHEVGNRSDMLIREYIEDPEDMEASGTTMDEEDVSGDSLEVLDALVKDDARQKIAQFLETSDANLRILDLRDRIIRVHCDLPKVVATGDGRKILTEVQEFFESAFNGLREAAPQVKTAYSNLHDLMELLDQGDKREKTLRASLEELKCQYLKLNRRLTETEPQPDGETPQEETPMIHVASTTDAVSAADTASNVDTASSNLNEQTRRTVCVETTCQTESVDDALCLALADLRRELESVKAAHHDHIQACSTEKSELLRKSLELERQTQTLRRKCETDGATMLDLREQLKAAHDGNEVLRSASSAEKKELENRIEDLRTQVNDLRAMQLHEPAHAGVTLPAYDQHIRECSAEKQRLLEKIKSLEDKLAGASVGAAGGEREPERDNDLVVRIKTLTANNAQLDSCVRELKTQMREAKLSHEAQLAALKSTFKFLMDPSAHSVVSRSFLVGKDVHAQFEAPSTSAVCYASATGGTAKTAVHSSAPNLGTETEPQPDDDEPLDIKPVPQGGPARGAATSATYVLEDTGGASRTLTSDAIEVIKRLKCPLLDDSEALGISDKWARSEWYLNHTPHKAFTWITRNASGKTPVISCLFCPVESCFAVFKVQSQSIAYTVRNHYQTVHSHPRKCLAPGCRKRWTKNAKPNTWCLKKDSTNQIILDQVRCESHSLRCSAIDCFNRWYDGIPETDKWIVVRSADGRVDAGKLLCAKHTIQCAVEDCPKRWHADVLDGNLWSVPQHEDGTVNEEELRCPEHAQ